MKHGPGRHIFRLALTLLIALSVAPLAAGLQPPAAVGAATEIDVYPIPTAGGSPFDIAAGADGALWFTEFNGNKVGRITTSGQVSHEFPLPTAGAIPLGIAAGPDGNLWFVEQAGNKVGRITPSGIITEYTIPTPNSAPLDIAAGPDGALWFTEGRDTSNKIGRITTTGRFTEYSIPTAGSFPYGIAAGPDGNLWFTEYSGNKIGRITPAGAITEFPIPTPGSKTSNIAAGPDGNLWFVEQAGNKVGRITPSGIITEFPLPIAGTAPTGITAGPDGALWFTGRDSRKIGRITVSGQITEFVIPGGSRQPINIARGADNNLWFTLSSNGGNGIGRLRPNVSVPAAIATRPVTGGTYSILTPGPYAVGQKIVAIASPKPGFIFAGWVGAGLISDNGLGLISDNGHIFRPAGLRASAVTAAPDSGGVDGLVGADGGVPTPSAAPLAPALAAATPTIYPLGPWNPNLDATITDSEAELRPLFLERPSFSDVPAGYRAEETIAQLAARGIIRGYQADVCTERGLGAPCFGPEDRVLRAQMAALIARAMFWDAEDWTDANFPDQSGVDDDLWRNVRTLAHYKVALGYDDGTYNPSGDVLYVQTVLFISRAMVARGYWTPQPDNPDLYPNLPSDTPKQQKDRQDVATYVHYAGALPDTPANPGQPFTNFDQPATREWFTRALYQAVDSYFGR